MVSWRTRGESIARPRISSCGVYMFILAIAFRPRSSTRTGPSLDQLAIRFAEVTERVHALFLDSTVLASIHDRIFPNSTPKLDGCSSLDYFTNIEFEWDEAKSEACFVDRGFDFT